MLMKKLFCTLTFLFAISFLAKSQVIVDFEDPVNDTTTFLGDLVNAANYATPPAIVNNTHLTGNNSSKVLHVLEDKDTYDQSVAIWFNTPAVKPTGVNRITFLFWTNVKPSNVYYEYGRVKNGTQISTNALWCTDSVAIGRWDTMSIELTPKTDTIDYIRFFFGNMKDGSGVRGDFWIDNLTFVTELLNLGQPKKILTMKKAATPPQIDGTSNDDIWDAIAQYQTIDSVTDGTIDKSKYSCKFKVSYDDDYFYLFATIKDPTPTKYLSKYPAYFQDGLEIFFDPRHKFIIGQRKQDWQHQIRINYGGNGMITGWDSITISQTYLPFATIEDNQGLSGGYNIEAAIAWKSMYTWKGVVSMDSAAKEAAANIKNPFMVGFGISLLGCNTGGTREGVLEWSSNQKAIGKNVGCYYASEYFGALVSEDWMGIEKISKKTNISVYPNPVADHLQLDITDYTDLNIYDVVGNTVFSSQTAVKSIDVAHLGQGIYFIQANGKDNQIYVGKFIKK